MLQSRTELNKRGVLQTSENPQVSEHEVVLWIPFVLFSIHNHQRFCDGFGGFTECHLHSWRKKRITRLWLIWPTLDAKIFLHSHCVAFLKILGFFYCLISSLCDYLVDSHKRNHFIGRKTEDIVELSKSWRTGWRGQNTNWTNEVYIYFNLWCYDFVLWVDSPSKSRLDFETFGPVREMDQSSFEAFETFRGIKFHDVWNHSRNSQVKFCKITRRRNRANCTHIYPNPQFCPDRKLRKSL